MPEEARETIEKAGLPLRSPFAELSASGSRRRHSVHDLRHAFAVRLYQGDEGRVRCQTRVKSFVGVGHGAVPAELGSD